MPMLCFDVSDLQQRKSSLKVSHLLRANFILKRAQEWGRQGFGLSFPAGDTKQCLACVHDASFGNQPGSDGNDCCSQQGHLLLLGNEGVFQKETQTHLLEWGSSKIKRVVRSTLAAEAAAASHACDRATFCRALLGEVLFGKQRPWQRMVQSIKAGYLTDCNSLFQHCQKDGASTTEKRVMLDLADLKQALKEYGDLLRWTPTNRMLADAFTKHIPDPEVLLQYLKDLRYGFYPDTDQGGGTPPDHQAE